MTGSSKRTAIASHGHVSAAQVANAPKRFAEFFAGIGLVHEALKATGWSCEYANDIDPKKEEMYKGHFGDSSYFHREDVWNTDQIVARLPSELSLATASFPCVDVSLAGHWRGLDGTHSSTFFAFARLLDRIGSARPPMVMIENVPGLIVSNGGGDLSRVCAELAACGYWIDAFLLDARHFVPQSRPRLFILGFHDRMLGVIKGDGCVPSLFGDADTDARTQEGSALRPARLMSVLRRTSLATGLAIQPLPIPPTPANDLSSQIDLDNAQDWWPEPSVAKHMDSMEVPSRERVDRAIRSGATAIGAAFRRTRRGATRLEVRFDVAGCLRTPKGGSAKQIIVAIDSGRVRMRWMSAREYARLQGAGEYRIAVPPLQAMYGFGDAVCVPAIRWIDEHVLTPRMVAHRHASPALAS